MPYVYLIQPVELVSTTRFKIGMSSLSNLNRLRSYKNGTKYLMVIECDDVAFVEQKLIKEFRRQFKLIGGNEYFECGSESNAMNAFIKVLIQCKRIQLPVEPQQADETTATKPTNTIWMKRFGFKPDKIV